MLHYLAFFSITLFFLVCVAVYIALAFALVAGDLFCNWTFCVIIYRFREGTGRREEKRVVRWVHECY